jgi:BirA family transcriptional regulator, biotin operon repressor / biotin---[acetyl-CoA-carboxylase] ligase
MRAGGGAAGVLGLPRLHERETRSTNERARALAAGGAPHGTLVTAGHQTAGRGRQGRTWSAPADRALLASLVLRTLPELLPLAAAVAVAEAVEASAPDVGTPALKWPNDVLVDGRKVAGILVEGRPQEGWAVLGIGVNVAVGPGDLPGDLAARAAGLNLEPDAVDRVLAALLGALERWLTAPGVEVLEAFRARDALRGREVSWARGSGRAAGVDGAGRLVVELAAEEQVALESGEVHLSPGGGAGAREDRGGRGGLGT